MPYTITDPGMRQTHPIYHNKSRATSSGKPTKMRADSPEKTTAIPKTYDAIKSAAGGDGRLKVKK